MAWYGRDAMPFLILVPAALAGLLVPYLGRRPDPKLSALGSIVAFAGISSLLTCLGLGASVLGTIWALAGLLSLSDVSCFHCSAVHGMPNDNSAASKGLVDSYGISD